METKVAEVQFGYYPRDMSLQVGPIHIEALPTFDEAVSDVSSSEGVEKGWIYAPPQEVRVMGRGFRTMPYPSRVFGLSKTHLFAHADADGNDHVTFHLWALSFFTGMRLTATEAGFLDATPIQVGRLVDFGLAGASLEKAIALAESFWHANRGDPQRPKLLGAAVHALFLGQNPRNLQFEDFVFLYTAFDACYRLAASLAGLTKDEPHNNRIHWTCSHFGINTPPWATTAGRGSEVSALRNRTLHEALFMDEPLGFAVHGIGSNTNLPLQMRKLICRILMALVGAASADYVKTAIGDRQRHLVRL